MRKAGIDLHQTTTDTDPDEDQPEDDEDDFDILQSIDSILHLASMTCRLSDYFEEASLLVQGLKHDALLPYCTFADTCVGFHLNYHPSFNHMTVNEVSTKYNIPDLSAVITEYVTQTQSGTNVFTIGRQQANIQRNQQFPVSHLEV